MKPLEEIRKFPGFTAVKSGIDGGYGVVHHGKLSGSVVWSFGGGWEHVSVSPSDHSYTPSWEDMCWLKDLFFKPEEWAVQFHPAESEYVNFVKNCLHLWRPTQEKMPTPPNWMVGPVRKREEHNSR